MSRAVEWENKDPASHLITFRSTTPATQLKDNPALNYDCCLHNTETAFKPYMFQIHFFRAVPLKSLHRLLEGFFQLDFSEVCKIPAKPSVKLSDRQKET